MKQRLQNGFDSLRRYAVAMIEQKPNRAAMVSGALLALALPPFHIFPILLVSFPALYQLLMATQSYRALFIRGFLFSLFYHVVGLYWIGNALLVNGWQFAWAYPLAIFGFPAYLSLYNGLLAMAFKPLRREQKTQWNILTFAVLWWLSEIARGTLFTGFPWSMIGYTWATTPLLVMLQSVSVFGIYGLSFLTVIWAMATPLYKTNKSIKNNMLFQFVAATVLLNILFGCVHLLCNQTSLDTNTNLRLVQANIAQKDKWNYDRLGENFTKHLTLSETEDGINPDIVIWPETALPSVIKNDTRFSDFLEQYLGKDTLLLTGVLDIDYGDAIEKPKAFNRLSVFNTDGKELYHYNKSHLVPFGEYMPLAEYLPVNPVAGGGLEFTAGNGVTTAHIDGIPTFSPLVCYEVIFPGKSALNEDNRPDWIINVTNDGWYGYSTGPLQHLAIARTRAVEQGLPLVRSAGTGISAVIDPVGRLVGTIGLHDEGILDTPLPMPIEPTLFSRF